MKKTFVLLIVLTTSLAYTQKSKEREPAESNPPELSFQQKDSLVKCIYDRIYNASGVQGERPELKITNEKSRAASYIPSKNTPKISLEAQALDVCISFGDLKEEAIAFILSHEIGHHFTYDFWEGNTKDFELKLKDSLLHKYGFDTLNNKATTGNVVRTLQEIKADERGNILRYMAGYASTDMEAEMWTRIYKKYNFSDTMSCYPPLQERIHNARIADQRAKSFANIFELANYAVLLKDYAFAIDQYKALIHEFDFESREIYNNIAVAYYLKALQIQVSFDYVYPVELDLKSRFQLASSRGDLHKDAIANLKKAEEYFRIAIQRDPEYWTGRLNLGCILTILGEDYDGAKSECKKVLKFSKDPFNMQNARMVLALIELKNEDGDRHKGEVGLEELAREGNELARMNMSRIPGNDETIRELSESIDDVDEPYGFKTSYRTETIGGIDPLLLSEVDESRKKVIQYGNPRQILDIYQYEDAHILVNEGNFIFVSTPEDYKGSTAHDIRIGSSEHDVKTKYGLPHEVMVSAQGWVYHYPNSSLLIVLNVEKKVVKWVLYRN